MTLAENVALPLQQYSGYSQKLIDELVELKLALGRRVLEAFILRKSAAA